PRLRCFSADDRNVAGRRRRLDGRLGHARARALAHYLMACRRPCPRRQRQRRIVGTWKLVSVVYEDAQTKERTPVLGEHPHGYQIATPEGRWIAVVTADGRPVPKTDEDRAKAL